MTQASIEALEKANKMIVGISERIVASLGESDTDKLIELIDRLTQIYKEMVDRKYM